jgi:preprotein translocase subunit YajC
VHTTSGLQATIKGITDDTVDLEIAPGVITTWMKLAVRDRIEDDDDDDDDDFDADDAHLDAADSPYETTSAIEAPSDPDSVKKASGKTDG